MRFGAEESRCRSCHQVYEASDLDRYLWCPACRKLVRRRGARWARIVGFAASSGLILYLILRIHPSPRFFVFYAMMIVLTFVLTSRIAAAVVQGYYRARGGVADAHPSE